MKKRIDLILVEKDIAETQDKAKAMIIAGQIFVDDRLIIKGGELHNIDSRITLFII